MPVLVVADEFPWPTVNGSRMRIANMIGGLRETGEEIDLFCVCDRRDPDDRLVPAAAGLARCEIVDRSPLARSWSSVARWAVSPRPREFLWRDWSEARRRFQAWVRPGYDLTWFTDCDPFLAVGDLAPRPHIVEYDDLDSSKIAHRRQLGRLRHDVAADRLRTLAAAAVDAVDERRWRRVEADIARRADRVVVCSDLDRARLRRPAAVIPNGYELPGDRVPEPPAGGALDAPVLLFVGLLTYPPNVDAAHVLAREVLPAVRAELPGATLRLVGRPSPEVEALARKDGVCVVGPVADLEPELALADMAAVPIRFGGGTRIKILEAFAHRLPVVSTTVGCEGIDVVAGTHLLVADEPSAFAQACTRMAKDGDLRQRIAQAGWELYDARYRWDRIRPLVTDLAEELSA